MGCGLKLLYCYWYPSVGLVNLGKAKQGAAKQKNEVAMMDCGYLYLRTSNQAPSHHKHVILVMWRSLITGTNIQVATLHHGNLVFLFCWPLLGFVKIYQANARVPIVVEQFWPTPHPFIKWFLLSQLLEKCWVAIRIWQIGLWFGPAQVSFG